MSPQRQPNIADFVARLKSWFPAKMSRLHVQNVTSVVINSGKGWPVVYLHVWIHSFSVKNKIHQLARRLISKNGMQQQHWYFLPAKPAQNLLLYGLQTTYWKTSWENPMYRKISSWKKFRLELYLIPSHETVYGVLCTSGLIWGNCTHRYYYCILCIYETNAKTKPKHYLSMLIQGDCCILCMYRWLLYIL